MKLFFTIALLTLSFIAKAQQFSTLEYYFDTDPGYGNGSHTSISGSSLDADVSLTIPALPAGMHLLYTRIKDDAGHWGTTYQQNIFINSGTAGATGLTTAEYFFDTDPGFGNGTQVTLSGAAIDADVNFNMGSLPAGLHTLYLRLKNNGGAWSTVYQSNIFVNAGIAGSAAITAAEYYFDTDPGVGHATTIALNSGNTLDSSLKLNTAGLSNGMHTVVIRLKNNSNAWSTSYENEVSVFSGTDSIPKINSLEVFTDTDRGIHNNIIIPLTPKANLDTTLSIFIPDNGASSRTLGMRLSNQAGQAGNVALQNISLCELYNPKAGFRTSQYANTVTLIDTSKYNPSRKLRWYADGVLFDSSYTTNYTFPADFIGTKDIKLVAGTGCRVDSSTHIISMQGVEQYSPTQGSYASDFELNIYGGGMDTNLVVYMQHGDTIVYPYAKFALDGKRLIAVFDFHSFPKISEFGGVYEYDNYKLHVIFPNGYHFTNIYGINMVKRHALNECDGVAQPTSCHGHTFSLEVGVEEPYFQTTLTGNTDVRTGVWSTFSLNVTNTGSATARSVPVYLLLPAHFKVDTSGLYILTGHPELIDSIGLSVPIDTVIYGQHVQLRLYAFIVPLLAPGETYSIPFRVLTTQGGESKIMYWADKRMFGSPFKAFWGPCVDAIFNLVVGFVPIAGCLNSLYDFASGAQSYLNNPNPAHKPSTGSMLISTAGTLLSCATGVPLGSAAVAKAAKTVTAEIAQVLDEGSGAIKVYVADKVLGGVGYSSGGESNPCSKKTQDEFDEQTWYERFGVDPNHLSGNNQYDTAKHWIDNYSSQKYFVEFENKPTATANTQHVYVTDTLNPAKFVFSTFKMNHFILGDSLYILPPFRYTVTQDVAIKSSNTMKVRFSASFDTTTGILRTDFFSIDNNGKPLSLDSIAGFLPPNTDGENGTGSIQFEISSRALNTLDTFSNKATIYFDNNDAIATNTWMNTVDTTSPKSKIISVIPVSDSSVKLVMQQSDIGSGVKYISFYIKAGNDTLFRNEGIGTGDTILFKGTRNQIYQAFTIATDRVGNREFKDSATEISFVIANPLPLKLLSFTGKIIDKKTQLNWTTANEINTARFEVERSIDGINFTRIGTVAANNRSGTNNYISFDTDPQKGNDYYRLKQFDLDGHYTYSNVIKLYYGDNGFISVAPNPAKDYVDILTTGKVTEVILLDASGKKIKQFTASASNRYALSGVSKGMYFLRVMIDSELQTFKLVIE